jgi:PleD family two-component response regulator
MKHTVRAFSVGLITAGLVLFGVFYFNEDTREQAEDMPTEELINQIEEDGFRVITEEEYISFSLANDASEVEVEEETTEDEDQVEDSDENENDNEEKTENADDEVEEEEEEAEENESEENESEEDEEEESPSTVLLTIEAGMASSHISNILEEEGLVDDAESFNSYLLEHDYSLYIQLGEHELETGMSYYEIAEALTN